MITVYRCYLFDNGGRFSGCEDFFADTEAEAIVTARAISSERTAHGFELWQGMRHLHSEGLIEMRVSASPAPASPSRFSLAVTPNLGRVALRY
jgi:hypothetical protein